MSAPATQPTNERVGREVLAFVGEQPPTEDVGRNQLRERLRERLADLGRWIENHPWDALDGSDLRPEELARWRDELVRDFGLRAHRSKTAAPTAPGSTDSARSAVLW